MPKAKKLNTRPSPFPASNVRATTPKVDVTNHVESEVDLDDLLARATEALQQRQNALISLASTASPLETVHLDPGLPVDFKAYMSETNTRGLTRLDPARLVVVDEASGSIGNEIQVAKNGLKKLVVQKVADAMAPALDYDAKTKKKMAKEAETAGPNWFNLPAPELTEEVKRDLHILQNRSVLDPKRHYKRETNKGLPKFFQIGTIVEGAADFYSARLNRKDRKEHIIDELLDDHQKRAYFKNKSQGIRDSKARHTKKGYKIGQKK